MPLNMPLACLESIRSGWHDSDGLPVTHAALDAATLILLSRPALSAGARAHPTWDGGILLEMGPRQDRLEVEVSPDAGLRLGGRAMPGLDALLAGLDARRAPQAA